MVDNKKDPSCGMPITAGIEDTVHYNGKVYGVLFRRMQTSIFLKDPEASRKKYGDEKLGSCALFTNLICISQHQRCSTCIVFAVGTSFLDIEKAIVSTRFKKYSIMYGLHPLSIRFPHFRQHQNSWCLTGF